MVAGSSPSVSRPRRCRCPLPLPIDVVTWSSIDSIWNAVGGSCHPLEDPEATNRMTTEYATSDDAISWTGTAQPSPAGTRSARGVRVSAARLDGPRPLASRCGGARTTKRCSTSRQGTLRAESTSFHLYDHDAQRRIVDAVPEARMIARAPVGDRRPDVSGGSGASADGPERRGRIRNPLSRCRQEGREGAEQ
jgi:hypothetical protein